VSIQKLGDGRYRIWLYLGRDATGRKRRYTEVVRGTKKAAEQRERELRRAQDMGARVDPRSGTVADYLEQWLQVVQADVRPRTFHRYEQITRRHLIPVLGKRKLVELSPMDIQQAKTHWLARGSVRRPGQGLHPQTVVHHLRVLHLALQYAVDHGRLIANPADRVKAPHVSRHDKVRPLNEDQAARLIETLDSHDFQPLFTLAMLTGMRPGEYLGLRWQDVDMSRRAIHVRQAVWQKSRHEYVFGPAKSDGSERRVALTDVELGALLMQRSRQAAWRLQVGSAWQETGLVFTEIDGTPLARERVRSAFNGILARAGIDHHRVYDLRHTMATLMLAQGEHPKVVQERLGHSKVGITLDTYSSVLPGIHDEAAERLAARFRRRGTVAGD
jgi:integrase